MTETIPDEVIEKMADQFYEERVVDGHWKIMAHDWQALQDLTEKMRAALKAAEAVGWVMVPVKATDHMVNKGYEKANSIGPNVFGAIPDTACDLAYRAMIAARPKVPHAQD
jgi:uncharacterized Ntn-hydrolase superfamily protein